MATSGIMVTSEPVRDSIVALTRSISAATSPTSSSIEAPEGLSKGTITATLVSTFTQFALSSVITIESAGVRGKGTKRLTVTAAVAPVDKGEPKLRELVRTNDMVLVSAVGALLDGANIHHLVLDQNMSIIEGSLGVLPRRILVHDDDNRAGAPVPCRCRPAHELRADD